MNLVYDTLHLFHAKPPSMRFTRWLVLVFIRIIFYPYRFRVDFLHSKIVTYSRALKRSMQGVTKQSCHYRNRRLLRCRALRASFKERETPIYTAWYTIIARVRLAVTLLDF